MPGKLTLNSPCPAGLITCCLLGFAFWFSLQWGMNTSPDSLFYMGQSNKLYQDFSISHFDNKAPPLYPFMQYVATAFSGDMIASLRFFHSVIFALNTGLFALLVFNITAGSKLYALLAIVIHCCNPKIYHTHSFAVTEPLFITFLLGALVGFCRYLDDERDRWLVLSGLSISLAVLTRFAGMFFLASFSLFLLLYLARRGRRIAISSTFIFGACGVALPIAWSLLKVLFDESGKSPREFNVHIIALEKALAVLDIYAEWLLSHYSTLLAAVLFLAVLALVAGALRRPGRVVVFFLVFASLFYILFIFISISFFDNYTPIDHRMLAPNLYLLLALILCTMHSVLSQFGNKVVLGFAAALTSVFVGTNAYETSELVVSNYDSGVGFYSRPIRQLKIHDAVKEQKGRKIYTNSPELVLIYDGREAQSLPAIINLVSNRNNENFLTEIAVMLEEVDEQEAAIVYYTALSWRSQLPNPEFFEIQFGMVPTYEAADGAIYTNMPD